MASESGKDADRASYTLDDSLAEALARLPPVGSDAPGRSRLLATGTARGSIVAVPFIASNRRG